MREALREAEQAGATTDYLYGLERLAAVQSSSARLWYTADALGSVRQTLDDTGVVLGSVAYDPWGQVQQGSVPTFGFTGELQQGSNVYLRARWYTASRGTFTSRDPFAGFPEQPYSLMPYQYAYSAPTTWTDPSGRSVAKRCELGDAACTTQIQVLDRYGVGIDPKQRCDWQLDELELVNEALNDWKRTASWSEAIMKTLFTRASGASAKLIRTTSQDYYGQAVLPNVLLGELAFSEKDTMLKVTVVHELAHIWDFSSTPQYALSIGLVAETGGGSKPGPVICVDQAAQEPVTGIAGFFCLGSGQAKQRTKEYVPGGSPASNYGAGADTEDWAEAVAATVYPHHPRYVHYEYNSFWDRLTGNGKEVPNMDTTRSDYVRKKFRNP